MYGEVRTATGTGQTVTVGGPVDVIADPAHAPSSICLEAWEVHPSSAPSPAGPHATLQALVEWRTDQRPPTADPTLPLLSELVTNSVRHAAVLSPRR